MPIAQEGHGLVKVSLTLGAARTALPQISVLTNYTLQFTRTDGTVFSEPTSESELTIELEAGTYTLVVTGYNSDGAMAAQGSSEVTVSENQETLAEVQLNSTQMESGTLTYTIGVPETLTLKNGILRLDPLAGGNALVFGLTSSREGTQVIPSGFYRAGCDLYGTMDTSAANKRAGKTMVVHIYDNLETKLDFTFGGDEFINDGVMATWVAGDSTEFATALTEIQSSTETNIDIYVNANISLSPVSLSGSGYSGKTIRVRNTGTDTHEISLNSNGALFTVGSDVTLEVESISLKGRTSNSNVVVYVDGGNVLLNSGASISGNSNTSSNGGGVYVSSGTFTMQDNAEVSGNTVFSSSSSYYSYGGGVFVGAGIFTMQDSAVVSGNTASYYSYYSHSYGGGVYVSSTGTFAMQDSAVVKDNTASSISSYYSYGGGVFVAGGTFTMQDGAVVSGNTVSSSISSYGGGGVFVDSSGTFTMQNSAVVSGNTASFNGGGVYVSSGTFTMEGSTVVSGNTSSNYGGGVFVNSGTFTMQDSAVIQDNTSSNYGGGVFVYGTFTMQDSAVIRGNTASSYGGGVFVDSSSTFTMHDSAVISGNTASSYGGGVFVYGTFRKEPRTEGSTSGIIYGSGENGVDQDGYDLKNTATYGSAVYVYDSRQKDTTVWETTSLSTDSSENWE
jgi:hypothetical protein